jgi:hypothetical protein
MRSVWSRVGAGSVTDVIALGKQAGEQHAGLHLCAGHGQVVVNTAQPGLPAMRSGGRPPRCRSIVAPICAAA